ncbi:MAG: murein L,D-transpeptidase catalytic domain family protein [Flavobacteriales bacterium]|nr:murein L,D-transpeptidase catalytic domain family protein [Flavobacteriales bacterium]
MVNVPVLFIIFLSWLSPSALPVPAESVVVALPVVTASVSPNNALDAVSLAAEELFEEIGLDGQMTSDAFIAGYKSIAAHKAQHRIMAIADMTKPSTDKRLYLIDLEKKKLIMRTWVAHGSGTGELYAEHFSNISGSHQTSLGLYRVGVEIVSPKHGAALLLHGLDRNLNDPALEREVIMHGADYVSSDFIAKHGRLGRSWGCPTVSKEHMPQMLDLLADGGLLFIYGR